MLIAGRRVSGWIFFVQSLPIVSVSRGLLHFIISIPHSLLLVKFYLRQYITEFLTVSGHYLRHEIIILFIPLPPRAFPLPFKAIIIIFFFPTLSFQLSPFPLLMKRSRVHFYKYWERQLINGKEVSAC